MSRWRAAVRLDAIFVPTLIVVLGAYLTFSTDLFLTESNLRNILLQATILAIVSFGATFVILAGELDLSVGVGVALTSVVAALALNATGSLLVCVLAGLGTGIVFGAVNGALVTLLEVPSFMATLGTLTVGHGIALAITDGGVVAGLPPNAGDLANDKFLGVQWAIWLMLVVFVVLYLLQSRTAFGLRVLAVGGNREAARLSGIPVKWVIFASFLIVGVVVGLGGLVLMSRVQSGQPNAESLLGLQSIAAIVVGGNNLLGGRGSIAKTLWGVLLISVLTNGLDLQGVAQEFQEIIIGFVFIAAASVDFVRRLLRRTVPEAEQTDFGGSTEPPSADSSQQRGNPDGARHVD